MQRTDITVIFSCFYLRRSPGHRVARVVVVLVGTYHLSSKFPKLVQINLKSFQNQHGGPLVTRLCHGRGLTLKQDIFGPGIGWKCLKTSFSWSRWPPIEKLSKRKLLSTPENGGTGHIKSRTRRTYGPINGFFKKNDPKTMQLKVLF